MKRPSAPAVIVPLLALLLGYSWAHRPDASGQGDRPRLDIALVDMVKLFNADKDYVSQREELQKEVAEAQKTLQEKQQALLQLQEEGRKAKPNSEEQKRIGEELRQKARDAEMFRQNHVNKVLETEKSLNIKTWQTINERIQRFADDRGIRLVIRYTSQPVDDSKSPQEVLALINQDVVYQNGLDVTEDILQTLN